MRWGRCDVVGWLTRTQQPVTDSVVACDPRLGSCGWCSVNTLPTPTLLVPSHPDNQYRMSVLMTQNSLYFLKPLSVISGCDFSRLFLRVSA